jgi:hypothetical protein
MFRRKGKNNDDDSMTISAFSMGGSSVSDRIMGRMRVSLGSLRNLGSSERDALDELDDFSASGGGSAAGGGRKLTLPSLRGRRSNSVGRMSMPGLDPAGPSTRSGSGSSNVMDGMMAEMNSNETMALMGRSMGRRAPSAPLLRPGTSADDRFGMSRGRKSRKFETTTVDMKPMEYSLIQLRQMSEQELEETIHKVGISSEEKDQALNEITSMDTSIETVAQDQRQNALVMLLINSGKVKLVRSDKGRRNSAPKKRQPSLTRRRSSHSTTVTSNLSAMENSTMLDEKRSSITSIPYNDEGDSTSIKSGQSLSSSVREKHRKSKMDKIVELQAETANVKRENKSLKKTVKKLLEQLTTMTQKEKEAVALAEMFKKEIASEMKGDKKKSVNGDESTAEEAVVGETADNTTASETVDNTFEEVKRKLKDEKSAHKGTEIRLKVSCS